MKVLVKINTFKIEQLKELLREKSLQTNGNKNELTNRLLEANDNDENVEMDMPEPSWQSEVDVLKTMMKDLMQIVQTEILDKRNEVQGAIANSAAHNEQFDIANDDEQSDIANENDQTMISNDQNVNMDVRNPM